MACWRVHTTAAWAYRPDIAPDTRNDCSIYNNQSHQQQKKNKHTTSPNQLPQNNNNNNNNNNNKTNRSGSSAGAASLAVRRVDTSGGVHCNCGHCLPAHGSAGQSQQQPSSDFVSSSGRHPSTSAHSTSDARANCAPK
jgi:hypothetical protein